MTKDHYGVWEIVLPPANGQPAIPHDSKLKVVLSPATALAKTDRLFPDIHGGPE